MNDEAIALLRDIRDLLVRIESRLTPTPVWPTVPAPTVPPWNPLGPVYCASTEDNVGAAAIRRGE